MKGLQYAIDLVDRTFGVTIKKAKASTQGLDKAVNQADKNISKLARTGKTGFNNITTYAKRAAAAVGLVFALNSAYTFGNEITNVAAKFEGFENAITFASGAEGAQNLAFLNGQIKDLNLDMTSSYKGFQTLTGSLRGTKLEGQGVRDIFEAVGIAATSMNLTADQSEGAFLALSQMASKGKVQAEELRGQLGERIPGALKIAADAMGVNQVEFNKMLDSGQVYAEEFLPKFAKKLKSEFSGGLAKAADSMQASINKKNNAIISFKRTSADFFRPLIISSQNGLVKVLGYIERFLPKLTVLKQSAINLLNAFSPLWTTLKNIGQSMGSTEGFISGLKVAMDRAAPVVTWISESLAGLIEIVAMAPELFGALTLAIWAVNIAMYANPVGLIIAGVVALIAVIGHAYHKVGWFRGSIMAVWETIKGFSEAINMTIIARFRQLLAGISGVAKAIKLVFDGEWTKAWEAGNDAREKLFSNKTGEGFVKQMKKVGKNAGNAYDKGIAEAAANASAPNLLDKYTKGVAGASANDKLLGDGGTGAGAAGANNATGGAAASVAGGGGSSTKHTTFNIKSMVQQLTVQTTNISGNPADLKSQLEKIFLELMGDLELRANS
tara:strand:- start:23254 stop:25086 length:1833 start_codon:yes stop_codon:yes gene_type:complete